MKITHKLILGLAIVTSLMLVFGFYAVGISQRALHRSIGESAVTLSTGVLQNIDLEMRNKIEVFEEYGMDLILQEAVIATNWEFDMLDGPNGFPQDSFPAYHAYHS